MEVSSALVVVDSNAAERYLSHRNFANFKAPCVKDPDKPHGPCIPCQKVGRSAEQCGPIELPPSRKPKLVDPEALLGNWVSQRIPQHPPPAKRPEHGLDLLGGTNISMSAPPATAQNLDPPDPTVNDLYLPVFSGLGLGLQDLRMDLTNLDDLMSWVNCEPDSWFDPWLNEDPRSQE